jgi:hypothetical protein
VTLWNILDQDESGDVSYVEFCDQIHKMKTSDPRTMLVFMKYYTATIYKDVHETLKYVKEDVVSAIKDEAKQLSRIQKDLEQPEPEVLLRMATIVAAKGDDSKLLPTPSLPCKQVGSAPITTTTWQESLRTQSADVELRPFLKPIEETMKESVEAMKDLTRRFECGLAKLDDLTVCLGRDLAPVFPEDPCNTVETHLDWLPAASCCGIPRSNQRIGNTHIVQMVSIPNESRGGSFPEVTRKDIPPSGSPFGRS